jgi:hypothetical protein
MMWPTGLTKPLASTADAAEPDADLEANYDDQGPRWVSWAKQAAERVRTASAEAAEQAQIVASQGIERAKSVDWSERVTEVQTNVSSSFDVVKSRVSEASASIQEKVMERASSFDMNEQMESLQHGMSESWASVSTTATQAAANVQEKGQAAMQSTKEYSQQGLESVRSSASSVADAATGALTHAGERVSGLQALTISPTKWAQFAGAFAVGLLFIMMSLNFLPLLLLSPSKFAVLFTIGSVTMLSSFVIFNGPKAFATSMAQRDKLPFSAAYGVGLVGTIWATMIMKSYILTAVFAIVQAAALLYFVASYLPGGKATVNACCRFSGRSVRTIVGL